MKRRDFLRLSAAAAGGYALALAPRDSASAELLDRGSVTLVRGTARLDGHTVPSGQTLRFDPTRDVTLELRGNLVVEGTLEMKPNRGVTHTLRFVGIDEAGFVGGGMDVLDTDVGLWVIGNGRLDIRGKPRAGWIRPGGATPTGTDTSWHRTDEILTTPFEAGDYTTFAPYRDSLSSAISPNGRVFKQEAFNLTRNVRIEGTPKGRTHIFIRSTAPQSIRYAAIRYVGPRQGALPDGNHIVLGRYGLHFHMCGEASRGSVVTGTVIRDCGSHAFVPHMSDGIIFTDCVAYNVNEDAYWWDTPEQSNDVQYQHCMAARLVGVPNYRGYALGGFNLGLGSGLVVNDCVVAGNQGNTSASGFVWPETTNSNSGLVWTMTNCVAHNNKWAGIFIWQNDGSHHTVTNFTSFRNGRGVEHGAYVNVFHIDGLLTFQNGVGVELHAGSAGRPPDYQLRYANSRIYDGISIVEHGVGTNGIAAFDGPIVSHVAIDERGGSFSNYDFVNCTKDGRASLEASDFTVRFMQASSVYRVQRPNGTAYQLNRDGTATPIAPFA